MFNLNNKQFSEEVVTKFLKIGIVKYFANILKKTPVLESLLNKFASLRLQDGNFPVKFAKFQNTCFYRTSMVAASRNTFSSINPKNTSIPYKL